VAFTGLAVAGTGVLVAAASHQFPGASTDKAIGLGSLFLVFGLALSSWHLGRRARVFRAALGIGHSAISQEGALGLLTAAAGVLAATGVGVRLGSPALRPFLDGAIVLFGIGFLVWVGLVYRLRGQLTWSGFSAATPLTCGLAYGAIVLNVASSPAGVSTVTLVAVGIDAFVFAQRWRRIARLSLDHGGAVPETFDRRHEWLGARFLLVDALPVFSLFVGAQPLAGFIATAGVFVDRAGFYTLGLQHRTELEVARVERVLNASASHENESA
jgi:DMSO reductase anchor subunit